MHNGAPTGRIKPNGDPEYARDKIAKVHFAHADDADDWATQPGGEGWVGWRDVATEIAVDSALEWLLNKIGAGPVAGLLGFVQLNHLLVLEIGEHVLDPMVSDVRNTRLRGQMHAADEI